MPETLIFLFQSFKILQHLVTLLFIASFFQNIKDLLVPFSTFVVHITTKSISLTLRFLQYLSLSHSFSQLFLLTPLSLSLLFFPIYIISLLSHFFTCLSFSPTLIFPLSLSLSLTSTLTNTLH